MKVILHFSRHFAEGTLKGLTHYDSINFVSFKSAVKWMRSVRINLSDKILFENLNIKA